LGARQIADQNGVGLDHDRDIPHAKGGDDRALRRPNQTTIRILEDMLTEITFAGVGDRIPGSKV